ncbi:MAG: Na(+)/H(+) antiporter subunit D [Pirellula sp.]|jgi:multicomponent Na+:H+ antiporter subunit D
MIDVLPPGWVMMLGSPLLLLLPKAVRSYAALVLSVLSLALFCFIHPSAATLELFGLALQPIRVDALSWPFVIVFHIAAILSSIYSLHVQDLRQQISGLVYAGSAIAACCAGDLVSLFLCWELTAISSVFLIWASDTPASYRAGMRYLIIQVSSGVLLLSGAIIQLVETKSIAFVGMVNDDSPLSLGSWLILAAFGIKAAFPLLHNWLQDSYPQATVTGTVFLSAFTTKLAIYALARGFPGLDLLIGIGCVMTLFPILFAVIENDLRRVLSYSLNNQLGFMVVGIGIGTELAINGTVAHAFCHILYKALLFMTMGAVLFRVGTCKGTELGGLYKSMPLTTIFCLIGAGAISGFPLLSGFVSKSMIISAAGEEHLLWVWMVLLIASAGVMEHSGIKIPFFAFFAHDSGKRVPEAPTNMLIAMGGAAALCVGLGVAYPLLYNILPFSTVDHPYQPYTTPHVVAQLQLLGFAALAFVFLIKFGLYPAEERATNLDTDWFYRKAAPKVLRWLGTAIRTVDQQIRMMFISQLKNLLRLMRSVFGERGAMGSTWSTNIMAFWATLMLVVALLLNYLNMLR